MIRMNKRGQTSEAGPIQGIIIGLVLVIAVTIGFFNFLDKGLITNYETPILDQESAFTTYIDQQDELTSSINETKTRITQPGSGAIEIAGALITGGFNVLRDFIGTPLVIADTMISTAASSLGIPSNLANLAWAGLLVIIIFAILALIMKVRA